MICHIYECKDSLTVPVDELLRYAGMPKGGDPDIYQRAAQSATLCEKVIAPRCVWQRYRIQSRGNDGVCLDNGPTLRGSLPTRYLSDCDEVILVLATVGQGADRMIAAQGVRSMTDALLADAAGSAAVEALLDAFCDEIAKSAPILPRISPGYGDFSLENQIGILCCLDGTRNLGVYLNDSLLMIPTKSVSALIGIRKDTYV